MAYRRIRRRSRSWRPVGGLRGGLRRLAVRGRGWGGRIVLGRGLVGELEGMERGEDGEGEGEGAYPSGRSRRGRFPCLLE